MAEKFLITDPDDNQYQTDNLTEFCAKHSLNEECMREVARNGLEFCYNYHTELSAEELDALALECTAKTPSEGSDLKDPLHLHGGWECVELRAANVIIIGMTGECFHVYNLRGVLDPMEVGESSFFEFSEDMLKQGVAARGTWGVVRVA